MEEQWYCDRAKLRELRVRHPEYSRAQLMAATGRSLSWVKKWLGRFKDTDPNDELVLWGKPRLRKQTPPQEPPDPLLVARVLDLRDHPPDQLRRTPGPRTILYYLKKDQLLSEAGVKAPNSTSRLWRILVEHDRITRPKERRPHQPVERPEPLSSWQVDYKDASSVTTSPTGKKQHQVEILNVVDVGTSLHPAGTVREDFNAKTSLKAMADIFKQWGLPKMLTFDRDTRWVGSASGRDFPSAFVRFLHGLGITVNICPPHRPDLDGFVERFHRSLKQECLNPLQPQDVGQVREYVEAYHEHYNWQRPHQGLSCHDLPPRVAFPQLPPLPGVPLLIDPDKWLYAIDGQRYLRKVRANGTFELGRKTYYLGMAWAGFYVTAEVRAEAQQLIVRRRVRQAPSKCQNLAELTAKAKALAAAAGKTPTNAVPEETEAEAAGCGEPVPSAQPSVEVTSLPIKGLYHGRQLSYEEYVGLLEVEATTEQHWRPAQPKAD